MAKSKRLYVCSECGAQSSQWAGQCASCHAWNSLSEEIISPSTARPSQRFAGFSGSQSAVTRLSEVKTQATVRLPTGLTELDRVLGGGLVPGSVVLLGGDPGIGKSTLLIQTLCQLSQRQTCLYVTGEESLEQVTLRARRLGLPEEQLLLLAETQVELMLHVAQELKPQIMVADSIQTLFTEALQSAPGAVAQVRECAAQLVRYAKQTGTALFLVGHVTKEGTLAGPRVLEHMVDTVLYFEGEQGSRFRVVRAVKNRFGAVNELGIFAMTDRGLKEVTNPSAIFLSRYQEPTPGSVVMASWEGSRPMLVEVQALVDQSHLANPRRLAVGLDQNRMAMLLAVLNRHGGIATYDQDVFVNVVGGVRVLEPGADLAVVFAALSSLKNRPLPADLIVFGEVGLAGEIRPVQNGLERLNEAAKHGFKRAIVPRQNAPKQAISNLEVVPVQTLSEALSQL